MSPVGFEPTISAGERPQTYALDRAATGTGCTEKYAGEITVVIICKFIHSSFCVLKFVLPARKQNFNRT